MTTAIEHLERIRETHGSVSRYVVLDRDERLVEAQRLVREAASHVQMAAMGVAFVLASGDFRTARETAKKVQPDLDAALAKLGVEAVPE